MSNGNEPAFPIVIDDVSTKQFSHSGLTKREYFSGLAMQALLSTMTIERDRHARYICETSVEYADQLLRELSSNKESGE